ncbi:MAG: DNA lyase [Nanoarchaeota archaeon]|nr:DNA lyase [Nanoarchaeota archaeon]
MGKELENELYNKYSKDKESIKKRIDDFRKLSEQEQFKEYLFCMLTPQSNAKKCWEAVEQIMNNQNKSEKEISMILKTRTRFYNNKTRYVLNGFENWNFIKSKLDNGNIVELRNWLAENVNGYGLKEASHFLRNIGKSDNKIAILDRHILRNLKSLDVIPEANIKNKKNYFEIEESFIKFAEQTGIPIDELDLLFWSKETGEIFK